MKRTKKEYKVVSRKPSGEVIEVKEHLNETWVGLLDAKKCEVQGLGRAKVVNGSAKFEPYPRQAPVKVCFYAYFDAPTGGQRTRLFPLRRAECVSNTYGIDGGGDVVEVVDIAMP